MDLLLINILYQYLIDYLLNLITALFFLFHNLRILYGSSRIYGHFGLCSVLFSFVTLSKINHFIFRYCSNSFLYTFPGFTPYGYDMISSKVCNLLLSLLLSTILLTSSINTLFTLLLNLC